MQNHRSWNIVIVHIIVALLYLVTIQNYITVCYYTCNIYNVTININILMFLKIVKRHALGLNGCRSLPVCEFMMID